MWHFGNRDGVTLTRNLLLTPNVKDEGSPARRTRTPGPWGVQEQDRRGDASRHRPAPSRDLQLEAFSARDGHFHSVVPDGFFCHKTLFECLGFQRPQHPEARRSPAPPSPSVRFEPSR